jgi:hypothetical protein
MTDEFPITFPPSKVKSGQIWRICSKRHRMGAPGREKAPSDFKIRNPKFKIRNRRILTAKNVHPPQCCYGGRAEAAKIFLTTDEHLSSAVRLRRTGGWTRILTGANRGNGEGQTRMTLIFANYGPAQPVRVNSRNSRQGFSGRLRVVADTVAHGQGGARRKKDAAATGLMETW